MPKPYSTDPVVERSLRNSHKDAAAYSVMAGFGETYFSAFAVFLKASTAQIGLIASLPPLLGSLAQLVSAWLGNRTGWRKSIILAGVYLQALSWLPIILLPLIFPEHALTLLIISISCYFACAHFAAPQWSSMMGDLVPEQLRGRFFGARTRLATVTSFLSLVAGGLLLHAYDDHGAAMYGFITIFSIAAAARLVSAHYLRGMHDPPRSAEVIKLPSPAQIWQRIHHSPFARFSLFFALMQSAVAISSPFFTVYMLRDLEFSYLLFMVNTAVSVIVQFLTLNVWGRISDQFGNRVILATTGLVIPLLPLLWLFSTDYAYLLLVQMLSGVVWAGFSLSAGNFIYDLVPSPKRATYVACHTVLMCVGVFAGALLGGYLGMVLPRELSIGDFHLEWHSALLGLFVISALARLAVALTFIPLLREVREVPPLPVSGLVFRVARYNALSGLVFDVILPTVRRKGTNEESPLK
ncbi:MAG: MFS transporter [Pseudomonadota bacterium]